METAIAAADTLPMMVDVEPHRDQVYSLCFFGKDWVVPEVQFLEAATDQDASELAGSMRPWMRRELWQRHRLVRVLPPTLTSASRF